MGRSCFSLYKCLCRHIRKNDYTNWSG